MPLQTVNTGGITLEVPTLSPPLMLQGLIVGLAVIHATTGLIPERHKKLLDVGLGGLLFLLLAEEYNTLGGNTAGVPADLAST